VRASPIPLKDIGPRHSVASPGTQPHEAARLGTRQFAWDSASRGGSPAQPRLGLSLTRRQPGSAHDRLTWDSVSRGDSPAQPRLGLSLARRQPGSVRKARAHVDPPQTGRGLDPRDSIGAASIGAATKLMSHAGRPGTARRASTRPTRSTRPGPGRVLEALAFWRDPASVGSGKRAVDRASGAGGVGQARGSRDPPGIFIFLRLSFLHIGH
jgi:hypothetical protein